MILFELKCTADHRFEAWFRDGAAYDAQAAAGTITCPVCGDAGVTKAPMAPRIAKSRSRSADGPADGPAKGPAEGAPPPAPRAPQGGEGKVPQEVQAEVLRQLAELRRTVETNCDYVGDRFAEEARRIHYGETDPRGIYGEATSRDVAELKEEGVTIHRIPWLPRTNS